MRAWILCLVSCGKGPMVPIDVPTPDPFDGAAAGDARTIEGVRMQWAPAATFTMGSPITEPERRPGETQHEVTLTRGFWIGTYEVTQGEWQRVTGTGPPATDAGAGERYPVYTVNFAQTEDFGRRLTELAHGSGQLPDAWDFRLPTEAQWEYAARAGTTTATSFGDSLSSTQANFQGAPYNGGAPGPSLMQTAPVGSYPANPWGLHDVHGNVFEWCRDWYHSVAATGVDPDNHDSPARSRVRRGGCYADEGWPCRSAFRLAFEPERAHSHIGFRVVAVRVR